MKCTKVLKKVTNQRIKMSAVNNLSLFVPFVFPNFDQKYVAGVFAEFGDVDRVDFVSKLDRDGKPFHSAYIHFKTWYEDEYSVDLRNEIEREGKVHVYHDNTKYYWVVLPNTSKKHNPAVPKTKINMGKDEVINSKVAATEPFDPEEWDAEASEEAAQMAEIEDELEAEDANLVSVDKRYLDLVEQENLSMRGELMILRQALANLNVMYQGAVAKM